MPDHKLKIAQIASEVSPFTKSGGLADVVASLSKALHHLKHEVFVITPLYDQVMDKEAHHLELIKDKIKIYLNSSDSETFSIWRGYLEKKLPVYFLENKKYFSQRKSMYGSTHENARFLVFAVAVLKTISLLKIPVDIIQCHDWHTGLIPYYRKTDFRYSKTLGQAKILFTIHNLAFQLGHNWWEIKASDKDRGRGRLPHLEDQKLENVNFIKRAILSADAINTVSEQYREEILTPKFGQDLHLILHNRANRLYGIVNGIDDEEYNPAKDPGLFFNYDQQSLAGKYKNKTELQKFFSLPLEPDPPVIGMVTRITEQKGFGLLFNALSGLMSLNIQLVIMGGGDKEYENRIRQIVKKYPRRISARLEFNTQDATKIYAGSDMILMPSRFEPCGITQLIAMRYGAIPVVRHIGGLIDTVIDFNPLTKKGNGFVFKKYTPSELLVAVARAVTIYQCRAYWQDLVRQVMEKSYSWKIPAAKYVLLYKKIRHA